MFVMEKAFRDVTARKLFSDSNFFTLTIPVQLNYFHIFRVTRELPTLLAHTASQDVVSRENAKEGNRNPSIQS